MMKTILPFLTRERFNSWVSVFDIGSFGAALILMSLLIVPENSYGQFFIFTEDFEDHGNTANLGSGRYTSGADFYDPATDDDYWGRVQGGTEEFYLTNTGSGFTANSNITYTGYNGNFFYAGEDLDDTNSGSGIGAPDGNDIKQIMITGIDITGGTNLRFSGLFGSGVNSGCGASEYDTDDFIEVYYEIDGGGEILGMCFNPDLECNIPGDFFNEPLYYDNAGSDGGACDGDGGGGVLLTAALAPFSFSILGTGSSLDIRVSVHMDAGDEEVAIDFLRVESATPVGNGQGICPTVSAAMPNVTGVCENAPFNLTATGLADMDGNTNGDQDFGIEFVAFTTTPADPYSGGTSLGTVPFGNLTAGNTIAALVGASLPTAGIYEIYAILSPLPIDLNCRPSAMTSISVDMVPNVSINIANDELCLNDPVTLYVLTSSPTGGTFSGPGVTDLGDGISFTFNPAVAGIGTHQVVYNYADPTTSCSSSSMDDILVNALPTVTFSAPPDLCVNAGVQMNLTGGTPVGGVYSGISGAVNDDGNGFTFDFDPAAAGVGIYNIDYTYTATATGCTNVGTDDVEVLSGGTATFTAPADLCSNAGIQTGLGGGLPIGGVYSGPGVTDDLNGETYTFSPSAAEPGIHTISYTVSSGGPCADVASDQVEVFDSPFVTLSVSPNTQCISAGVQLYTLTGSPTGGVYSGPGVTNLGDGISFTFDPANAGIGSHTVTYSVTNADGCTGTATDMITVNGGTISAGNDESRCPFNTTFTVYGSGGPGIWSVTAGSANITTPSAASTTVTGITSGSSATLTYTATSGCGSDDVVLSVYEELDIANAGANQVVCGNTVTLSANTPSSGTGRWRVSSYNTPGGSFSNPASPNSTFTGNYGTTYTLEWKITAFGPCSNSTYDFTVITLRPAKVIATRTPDNLPEDGSGNFVYKFEKTECPSLPVDVNFTIGGTADYGTDYSETSGNASISGGTGILNMGAGVSSVDLIMDPVTDNIIELDELISLTLNGGMGYIVHATSTATNLAPSSDVPVTILNDDVSAGPDENRCPFNPDFTVNGSGGPGIWSVTSGSANINSPNSASTLVTGIAPGSSATLTYTSTLGGNGDDVVLSVYEEPDIANAGPKQEVCGNTVALSANTPSSGTGRWKVAGFSSPGGVFGDPTLPNTTFTGTYGSTYNLEWKITAPGPCNNSTYDYTEVTFRPAKVIATRTPDNLPEDGSGNFVYKFEKTECPSLPVDVNFSIGGTADYGTDYSETSGNANISGGAGVLNMGAGISSVDLIMDPMTDNIVELDEMISLTLNGGMGYIVHATSTATNLAPLSDVPVTLENDDMATFTISDPISPEGNTGDLNTLVFDVTLDNPIDVGVSLDFITADNTAMLTAGDYAATGGTLNFAGTAGETMQFAATITGDDIVELDETIFANLSNLSAGGRNVMIADNQGEGTILNDDQAIITLTRSSVPEGNAGTTLISFDFMIDKEVDVPVSVDFQTIDGSALSGSDYTSVSSSALSLNFGSTTSVNVLVNGDCEIEPDEDFIGQLLNLTAGSRDVVFDGGLPTLDATGTILNEDELPEITCPGDVSQNTDPGLCATSILLPVPTVANICGQSVLEFRYRSVDAANNPTGTFSGYAPSSGNLVNFSKGKYEIEWRVTDGSGAMICGYFAEVIDAEKPMPSCAVNVVDLDAQGRYTLTQNDVFAGGTDNCGTVNFVSMNPMSLNCSNIGLNFVVVNTNDGNGNTETCEAIIIVQDVTPPVLIGGAQDMTVECDGAGNVFELNNWLNIAGNAILDDNCGIVSFSDNFSGFTDDCGTTGSAEVTFTFVDGAGLMTSTIGTFTIVDTQAPLFANPNLPTTIIECNDFLTDIPDPLDLQLIDCDPDAYVYDVLDRRTYFNPGTGDIPNATTRVDRTYYATDDCGNVSSNSQIYYVVDTQGPEVLFCPDDIEIQVPRGERGVVIDYPEPEFYDACGLFESIDSVGRGDWLPYPGSTVVSISAFDAGNNPAKCTFRVTAVASLIVHNNELLEVSIPSGSSFSTNVVNWNSIFAEPCNECRSIEEDDVFQDRFEFLGELNGHKYFVSRARLSQAQIATYSAQYLGYGASITSFEENRFLNNELGQRTALIGYDDKNTEGTFRWEDGSPIGYSNWAAGNPISDPILAADADLTEMNQNGEWENVTDADNFYVLEIPCYDVVVGNSTMPPGNDVPIGEYMVGYNVFDICGNEDTTTVEVKVVGPKVSYCTPNRTPSYIDFDDHHYITGVYLDGAAVLSGNDFGYSLLDRRYPAIREGQDYSLRLTSENDLGTSRKIYYRVWIDYNVDGDFYDPNELVYEGFSINGFIKPTTISIPDNVATAGFSTTRMRVAARKYTQPEACGDFTFGEVEDFDLRILNAKKGIGTTIVNHAAIHNAEVYPNPTTDNLWISAGELAIDKFEISDLRGKLIQVSSSVIDTYDKQRTDVSQLNPGTYFITLNFEDGTFDTQRFVVIK